MKSYEKKIDDDTDYDDDDDSDDDYDYDEYDALEPKEVVPESGKRCSKSIYVPPF